MSNSRKTSNCMTTGQTIGYMLLTVAIIIVQAARLNVGLTIYFAEIRDYHYRLRV